MNLWKLNISRPKSSTEDPRRNDVYPENEEISSTSESTNIQTSTATVVTFDQPAVYKIPLLPTTTHILNSSTQLWTSTTPTDPTTREQHIIITSSMKTPEATTKIEENTPSSNSINTAVDFVPTPPKKPKIRPYPHWGNWSKWSECSRSCGIGVMSQERKCITK